MTRPLLNHALLAVVIGLTFLAFLGTLCNTIDTNYFTTPAYPTLETTFPSFQPRMTRLYYLAAIGHPWLPTLHRKSILNRVRHLYHQRSQHISSSLSPQFYYSNCGQPRLYYLAVNNCHWPATLHCKSICNRFHHSYHQRSQRKSSLLSPHQRKDFTPPSIRICRTRNCPISTGTVDLCKPSSHQKSTQLYVDDVDVIQHDDNQVKAPQ
jgi:hypothetical protein